MKSFVYLTVLVAVAFGAAACNTIAGMGQDLRDLGHGISNAFNS